MAQLPYTFKASQYTVPQLIPGSGRISSHQISDFLTNGNGESTPTKVQNRQQQQTQMPQGISSSSKIKMKIGGGVSSTTGGSISSTNLGSHAQNQDNQHFRQPSFEPKQAERFSIGRPSINSNNGSNNSASKISQKILSHILSPSDSNKGRTLKTPDHKARSGNQTDLYYASKSMRNLTPDPMSLSNISMNSSFHHQCNASLSSLDLRQLASNSAMPSMTETLGNLTPSAATQKTAIGGSGPTSRMMLKPEQNYSQMNLAELSTHIKEKKSLLQEKKKQIDSIQSKVISSHHVSNINSMVENVLSTKCEQDSKKLSVFQADLAQQRDAMNKLENKAAKHKQRISNLQSKLEIIKQQEQRYETLKEKKLRDVQNEFDKKQVEMQAMHQEVMDQCAQFEDNLSLLQEAYNIDLETKSFLKEDLNARLIQRAELVAEKEDLEQLFEHFTQTFIDEYEYLTESVRVGTQIRALSEALGGFTADEAELNSVVSQLISKLESSESYVTHYTSKLSYADSRIAFEKEQPLLELNAAQAELTRLTNEPSFRHLPSLDVLCEELLENGSQLMLGMTPIENVVSVLMTGGEAALQRFLDSFAMKCFSTTQSLDEAQTRFMETLCKLFVSLVCLEQVNAKFGVEPVQFAGLIEKYSREAEEIRKELATKKARLEYLRGTIATDSLTLKRVEQSRLVLEENLKISARKRADVVFEKYCNENAKDFEQMRRENGAEYETEVKSHHQEEFQNLMEIQQKDRIQRMSRVNEDKVKMELRFQENVRCVEEDILPRLNELQIDLFSQKEQLESMQGDREAYEQTKADVQEDDRLLQECLRSKQEDIIKNLQGQFVDVIGKSTAIEEELQIEFGLFKESIDQIEAKSASLELLEEQVREYHPFFKYTPFFMGHNFNRFSIDKRYFEKELVDDIIRTQEKKRVVEGVRAQSSTGRGNNGHNLDEQIMVGKREIGELEAEISLLEATQLSLLNETTITPSKPSGLNYMAQSGMVQAQNTPISGGAQISYRSHANSLHNFSDYSTAGNHSSNNLSQRYQMENYNSGSGPSTQSQSMQKQKQFLQQESLQIGAQMEIGMPKAKLISTSFQNTIRKDELNDSLNQNIGQNNRVSARNLTRSPSGVIVSELVGQRTPNKTTIPATFAQTQYENSRGQTVISIPFMAANQINKDNQPQARYQTFNLSEMENPIQAQEQRIENNIIYPRSPMTQQILSQQGISYNFNYNSKPANSQILEPGWKQ